MTRVVVNPNTSWEVDVSSGGTIYKMIFSSSGGLQIPGTVNLLIGGFKGTFTHSNSVDRTYTLPDRTGTVALQDLTSLIAALPSQVGNAGKSLTTDGATISWTLVTGSSGITSLNGLTAGTYATQTFANGTTGTTPAFVSALGVHTLNIPMASAASVTAGLLSNTDYANIPFINVSNTFGGTQVFTNAPTITNPSTNSSAVATYGQLTSLAAGFSVRPPVAAIDTTDATLPTGNPIIDTYTVQIGDRVLATNLVSGNNEIYKATGTLSAVTWVLETDGQAGTGAPSVGDLVFVKNGTHAGQQWSYENGNNWVETNTAQVWSFSTGLHVSLNTVSVIYGTTISTACQGNDARLSDARTPTAHVLDSASHTVSGETPGALLMANSATTFSFTAISGDVSFGSAGASLVNNIQGVPIGNLGLTYSSATLLDNTGVATLVTGCSFATASVRAVKIEFELVRGAGNLATGYIALLYDGTNANITQNFDIEVGTTGLTLTADISGGNMRLLYTTTNTGSDITMKFYTKLFNQ